MAFSISGKTFFMAAVFVGGCVLVADFADQASTAAVEPVEEDTAEAFGTGSAEYSAGYDEPDYPANADYDDSDDDAGSDEAGFEEYRAPRTQSERSGDQPPPSVVTRPATSSERIPIPPMPPEPPAGQ